VAFWTPTICMRRITVFYDLAANEAGGLRVRDCDVGGAHSRIGHGCGGRACQITRVSAIDPGVLRARNIVSSRHHGFLTSPASELTFPSMILTLAGQKGGTGKSTLAINLAVEWMRRGRRVLLVDADPQGTSLTWANVAAESGGDAPTVIALGDNLRHALPALAQAADVTIIDTAGRQSKRLAGALMLADLALLPCRPYPSDIWALAESVDTVRNVQEIRPELVAAIVINGMETRTMMGRGARDNVAAAGLRVLASDICHRVAFAEACAAGKGVTTYAPKTPAAAELRSLADEIEALTNMAEAAA
jgi:chromosome partitioning protein